MNAHMEGTFRRICTAAQRSVPQPRPRRSGAQWLLPAAYAITSSVTAASVPSTCQTQGFTMTGSDMSSAVDGHRMHGAVSPRRLGPQAVGLRDKQP